MTSMADKIMGRVRRHGRGARVYSPRDFLDLIADSGSRAAVDQALSRLVKAGTLRRVGRGLYDWPRHSKVLGRPAPASVDAVVDAVQRRSNVKVIGGMLAAANALGLTHAVPTRPDFVASRKIGDVSIGGRTIRFQKAGAMLRPWLDSPAAPIVQAMIWLHDNSIDPDDAASRLRDHAPAAAKAALRQNISQLPAWAIPMAQQIIANHAINGA